MGSANFFLVLAAAASLLGVEGQGFGIESSAYPTANLSTNKASLLQGTEYGDYHTAKLSKLWVNNASLRHGITYKDGTTVRVLVLRSPKALRDSDNPIQGWSFAAGFFCTSPCDVFLFSVFIVRAYDGGVFDSEATGPQVVWSANRASPVSENATIELDRHGDLVLRDFDGKVVWSSGTSGKSVAGIKITKYGNLVLFDKGNAAVWQSFDHPTDSLVPEQSLREVDFEFSTDVMPLCDGSDLPKICREFRAYGDCAYPTVCGEYGICTNGQCTCPFQSNTNSNYFKPVDERKANLGCTPLTPISCQDIQHHELFTLVDVSYFDKSHTIGNLSRNECRQACLKNRSCRAAVFTYGQNASIDECFWVTKAFSLQSIKPEADHYNSTAYLKVQLSPSNSTYAPAPNKRKVILAITLPATSILVLLVIVAILYLRRKRKYDEDNEDSELGQLSSGTPTRFSFEKLRECTEGFSKQLGSGGFGSVFEGKLDEQRVAVKRLEGARQGKKEFLAEVETIGNIEHINLIKLIGFCAEKSQRLLVFGVVVFNMISGRKGIDRSQPEENVHLIDLLREKARDNQWIDLIDKNSDDMVSHQEEVIQMMKLAIWCLQNDSSHRPSMSTVIKVLEGAKGVATSIVQSFLNANSAMSVQDVTCAYSVLSQESILSGPR
uniref:Uncharacterized protein n=1 Tax=Avena sativa TaxID=4498 RepID=A0ACD5U006_AVESA